MHMHVQIKYSLAHLQHLFLTLDDVFVYYIPGLNLIDLLENALFAHWAWAYYASVILKIIAYKFGESNTEIIGCLQA